MLIEDNRIKALSTVVSLNLTFVGGEETERVTSGNSRGAGKGMSIQEFKAPVPWGHLPIHYNEV